MAYTIEFTSAARRELRRIRGEPLRRIDAALLILRENPRPPKAEKLKGGLRDYWRVRVGDFRILYAIEDDRLVVCVVRIADRKEAYR